MDTCEHYAQAAVWSLYDSSFIGVEPSIISNPYKLEGYDEKDVFAQDNPRAVARENFADGGKFRLVVKILVAFSNGDGGTTWMVISGWLISSDTVVTAGNVVYDWKHRYQRAKGIKCFIGYAGSASVNSDKHDVRVRLGERMVTTLQWIHSGPQVRMHDVAFIKLDRPFEGDLKIFHAQDPTPVSGNVILGVIGYPGDKELQGTKEADGEGGALMYEAFARTDYNLEDSAHHMIEYRLSPYGDGRQRSPLRAHSGAVKKIVDSPKSSGPQQAQLDSVQNNHLSKRHGLVRPQKSILYLIEGPGKSQTPAKVRDIPINHEGEDEGAWQAAIEATLTSRESTLVPSSEGRKSWDSNPDGLFPMNEA
ncbi:ATP synthase F1 [Colletotrichum acutatum]